MDSTGAGWARRRAHAARRGGRRGQGCGVGGAVADDRSEDQELGCARRSARSEAPTTIAASTPRRRVSAPERRRLRAQADVDTNGSLSAAELADHPRCGRRSAPGRLVSWSFNKLAGQSPASGGPLTTDERAELARVHDRYALYSDEKRASAGFRPHSPCLAIPSAQPRSVVPRSRSPQGPKLCPPPRGPAVRYDLACRRKESRVDRPAVPPGLFFDLDGRPE